MTEILCSTLNNEQNNTTQLSSQNLTLSPMNTSGELNMRVKLKKDALEFVDYIKEYQHDPKYKTELCKSWSENGFCAYGNKCRFAHGRQELFDKVINCKKYKQKECMSFFKNNYCCYGSRCHFKHEERRLEDIERSYFTYMNKIINSIPELEVEGSNMETLMNFLSGVKSPPREFSRLPAFLNSNAQSKPNRTNKESVDSRCSTNSKTKTCEDFSRQPLFTLNYVSSSIQLF